MLTYDPVFTRTPDELEEFLVFAVCVAGKNADQTIKKVREFLSQRGSKSPFEYLRSIGKRKLRREMLKHRLGQYDRIGKALEGLLEADFDLSKCAVEHLESIHGIGPKTARFFVMFTRPSQRYACLDTHILRWLNRNGVKAPKSTPSGRRYAILEAEFLALCDKQGMDPTKMDYAIWQSERGMLDG